VLVLPSRPHCVLNLLVLAVLDAASKSLDLAFLHLALHPLALRGFGGLGRRSRLGHHSGLPDQLLQAAQRVGPILFLGPVLLGLDHDDTIAADAAVVQVEQPMLVEVGQRRGMDVEAQMNRRGHLVNVLAARPLRADGAELDLLVGDADVEGYGQHGRSFLWSLGEFNSYDSNN